MRKLAALCLLFYSITSNAYTTGDSLNYLTPQDTIFLSMGTYGEKYFIHEMAPKQTLYSLARFYGLSVAELQYFNQGLDAQAVRIGTAVRVPVPNRAIRRYQDDDFVLAEHAPVYYVVKKGDTMYRIAKQYFKMPIEHVMSRNQLIDHTVKSGQKIHVGWLNINGIPDSLRHTVSGPLEKRNAKMRSAYLADLGGKRELEHQGVAAWQSESKDKSNFYALHRFAPINSIISVNNPMSRRTVYVKVIGRVPVTAYEPEVVTILSPLAAELLGAIDPRFFVRIKYHR